MLILLSNGEYRRKELKEIYRNNKSIRRLPKNTKAEIK